MNESSTSSEIDHTVQQLYSQHNPEARLCQAPFFLKKIPLIEAG